MNFLDTSDLKNNEIYLSLKGTFKANLIKKWIPSYSFDICLSDNTIVGNCNLRIDNSELTKYCGNIGYSIGEKYKGNKYSLKATELLLKLAKKHNLKYILITVEPNNYASNRICKLLKTELIDVVEVPKDHEMYEQGFRKLNIFKIKL